MVHLRMDQRVGRKPESAALAATSLLGVGAGARAASTCVANPISGHVQLRQRGEQGEGAAQRGGAGGPDAVAAEEHLYGRVVLSALGVTGGGRGVL